MATKRNASVTVEVLGAGEVAVVCSRCGRMLGRAAYSISGDEIEKARSVHAC